MYTITAVTNANTSINPVRLQDRVNEKVHIPNVYFDGIPVKYVASNGQLRDCTLAFGRDKLTIYVLLMDRSGFLAGEIVADKRSHQNQNSRLLWRAPKPYILTKRTKSDSDSSKIIDISVVYRIQKGPWTEIFDLARQKNVGIEEELSLSIFCDGNQIRSIDLILRNKEERDDVITMVDAMMKSYSFARESVDNDTMFFRYIWLNLLTNFDEKVRHDGKFSIDINDFRLLLKYTSLPIKLSDSTWREATKTLGENSSMKILRSYRKSETLSFRQALWLLEKLKLQASKRSAYSSSANLIWNFVFGGNASKVTAQEFLDKFLIKKQLEVGQWDIERVRTLFEHLNSVEMVNVTGDAQYNKREWLTRTRFGLFIESELNDAFDPKKEEKSKHKLKKPITHYWINSSHNTYLTGDQLKSLSSTAMYMEVLHKGCRCIELDIWDGIAYTDESLPVPIITHGGTLTSKIRFLDVIKSIRSFLDQNESCYPIILSFENHCSIPYQEEMSRILKDVLNEKLYKPPPSNALPSPEKLRGMVIIKGKIIEFEDEDDFVMPAHEKKVVQEAYMKMNEHRLRNSAGKSSSMHEEGWNFITPQAARNFRCADDEEDAETDAGIVPTPTASFILDEPGQTHVSTYQALEELANTSDKKIASSLAKLTFFHGTKFHDWNESIVMPTHHMHSFNDQRVAQKLSKKGIGNVGHCMQFCDNHMVRIYPSGLKFDSRNFSPVLGWALGSQLVALNFQTFDDYMRLNHGRFREFGGCGYVARPTSQFLDRNVIRPDRKILVKIRVLSGLRLTSTLKSVDNITPYVRVNAIDVSLDPVGAKEVYRSFRTKQSKLLKGNGLNADFSDDPEFFEFVIERKSVAMIYITVHNENDDSFIAFSSIPVSCLRIGYRSVKLYNASNERHGLHSFSCLILEIEKYDYKEYLKAHS